MTPDERIDRLERQLVDMRRRTRLVVVVAVALGAAGVAGWLALTSTRKAYAQADGDKAKKVVCANEFVMEDENGKVLARLHTQQGVTFLDMIGSKAGAGITIATNEDIAAIVSSHAKGGSVSLFASETGSSMQVHDGDHRVRAILSMGREGPELMLKDENGRTPVSLKGGQGPSELVLSDLAAYAMLGTRLGHSELLLSRGNRAIAMTVRDDEPMLRMSGDKSNGRIEMNIERHGPRVDLLDGAGRTRIGLGVRRFKTPEGRIITVPEPALRFFGSDGKLNTTLP